MSEGRLLLIKQYGPEIIIKCCREWKTHWGNGRWGSCGICHNTPKIVKGKTWED